MTCRMRPIQAGAQLLLHSYSLGPQLRRGLGRCFDHFTSNPARFASSVGTGILSSIGAMSVAGPIGLPRILKPSRAIIQGSCDWSLPSYEIVCTDRVLKSVLQPKSTKRAWTHTGALSNPIQWKPCYQRCQVCACCQEGTCA